MQTKAITVSRASAGQSEEVSASISDTIQANADLQTQLAASYESIALLEAERLTWLRANNEVASLNIDLIVELSDLKDAVRAYLSAPISRRGVCWARLKELTKEGGT